MARLSSAFRTALEEGANPVPVVTVYWHTRLGGTAYYASEPFQYFEQLIPDGGIADVPTLSSERPSDLGFQTFTVRLFDHDGAITRKLEGKTDSRRTRVVARWAIDGVAEADWFTFFDGRLDDWTRENGEVELACKTDDTALQGYVPKASLVTGSVPGLVNGARGLYAPIIYGIHDDQSLEGKGAVTCPNVILDATNGYWYLVGIGVMDDVPRVYKNGTLQTVSTHYTIQNPKWGGTTYTAIKFVSATVASDVVTADVQGLTDAGDGTGSLITGATDQLIHFLVNFAWGDWRTGDWLATSSAPIDTVACAASKTYLGKYGDEGSIYEGGSTEQRRAIEVVNRWLKSFPPLRVRWSNAGLLGVVPISHASGDYVSSPWVQAEVDERDASFSYRTVSSQIVSRVSLSYLPGERAGKLWQSLDLQDLALWEDEKVTENIALENSAARFQ